MARPARPLALAPLVALAACGDNRAPAAADADGEAAARFELVGHADLGARGMNAALAVAGDTIYVGSRIDGAPVLIVDVSVPSAPRVVGELGPPDEGLTGLSSRELRAVPDLDLLVVLDLQCSPDLHGCAPTAAERESLELYDISDRHAPVLRGRHEFQSSPLRPRGPHEMFLWRDPAEPARVLLYVSTPPLSPSLEVIDVSDPAAPVAITSWWPGDVGASITIGEDNLLHSIGVSADGRTGYVSHLQAGVFLIDLAQVAEGADEPAIPLLTPPGAFADWTPPEPIGPHSAVEVPGRDLLVVTDEVYPPKFGPGCPYGWLRVVDIADPAAPAVRGELRLAENQPAFCASAPEGATYAAHNATATANLALVSWHAAGLVAVDLTDPAAPSELARFVPEPLPAVDVEDPGIGGAPVTMWSYPVVDRGLIYVVDIRNGLYVLRYRGPHERELQVAGPLEGNSNLAHAP